MPLAGLFGMENSEGLGCVYFVKLNGLTPIKIGYSTNPTPQGRLETFAVGAPYGIELVGFIQSKDSKGLETLMHKRFASFRLRGEWFEISKEQVKSVCEQFMSEHQKDLLSIAYQHLSKSLSTDVVVGTRYPIEFSNWIAAEVQWDVRIDKAMLRMNYMDEHRLSEGELSQRKFTDWICLWCNENNLTYTQGKSGSLRWIMIKSKTE